MRSVMRASSSLADSCSCCSACFRSVRSTSMFTVPNNSSASFHPTESRVSDWNQRSIRLLDLRFETEDRATTRQRLTEGATIIGQWSTVGSTESPGAGPVGDAGCRAAPHRSTAAWL